MTPNTPDPFGDTLAAFDNAGKGPRFESAKMPPARALRREAKRRQQCAKHKDALSDIMGAPPAPGESVHIISAAKFDFWTWAPVMVHWLGATDHFYGSTWTLSRTNAQELLELYDAGKIAPGQINMLTGLYFKRRETATYTMLLRGILARGGRYVAFRNHAKVLLLANATAGHWLTVEGSANFNSNPRMEQYVITNDRALHDFHREWMEEALTATEAR